MNVSKWVSMMLCTRPTSLFDKKGLMNEAHKPELKNALLDQLRLSECVMFGILQDNHYVLDGDHFCKDVHALLEARLMKYVNPSKTIC